MDNKEAKKLLLKYAKDECTPDEKAWVESWYIHHTENTEPVEHIEIEMAMDAVRHNLPEPVTIVRGIWPRIAAAASVILALSFAGYYLVNNQADSPVTLNKGDVTPAIPHATLTLANGQQITLGRAMTGKLAQQGNTAVIVSAVTGLIYSNTADSNNTDVGYNTLTTVRGEHAPYPLQLADGTRVWLNAASSITFPVAFNAHDRKVTITGEAYFEVAHNAARPFKVLAKNQAIEDIGTHFNINAYDDEPVTKTTLLEGSISISKDDAKVILMPGQQGTTSANTAGVKVSKADTEETMAWKAGLFYFDHESLQGVMRKISRWYNVDVEYPEGKKLVANYWGTMSRETNISVVLNRLAVTNDVHFIVDGKKIIVLKK